MPCDFQRLPTQTIPQRIKEVQDAVTEIENLLQGGKVRVIKGPKGVTFVDIKTGKPVEIVARNRVTDACIARKILSGKNTAAKLAINKAGVDNASKTALTHHSHDGGNTWHHNH